MASTEQEYTHQDFNQTESHQIASDTGIHESLQTQQESCAAAVVQTTPDAGSVREKPTGNPLGDDPIPRLLLKYAPPAILSMMVSALYSIIDTFFVGHGVGQDGIAATTVAFPLMMLMGAFASWFGSGGNALAALRMGENRHEDAERALGNTLLLLIVVPLLLSVVALSFLDPFLDFLGATDVNRQMSQTFCRILLLGFVVQAVGSGLSNFMRTDGAPAYALVVLFIGTFVAALLNLLFVMILHWGMAGSACATIIGQTVTTILVLRYFLSPRARMRIRLSYFVPRASVVREICAIGFATFAVQVAVSLTAGVLNTRIADLGASDPVGADAGLAVIGTIAKITQLLFFVILGFSIAQQPILGFNYGSHRYHRVRQTLWITVASASVINLILWLLCRVFIDGIMEFFGISSDLHDFACQTYMLTTLVYLVVPLQVVGSNYFQATGQPLKATFLTLTRQLLFYLPSLFLVPAFLAPLLGLTPLLGLSLAAAVADLLAVVVTSYFLVREMKSMRDRESRVVSRRAARSVRGEHKES